MKDQNKKTHHTDACGFCGEHDCKPYYRPHGQECRSPLCEVTERAKKAEAEVEMLKGIKQIKVSKRPYDYECGDGCCSEYGETWSVDGVEVAHGPCDDNRLQQLLKHLGYNARIVNENEDGEEICEL